MTTKHATRTVRSSAKYLSTIHAAATVPHAADAATAFDATQADREAIDPSDLVIVNVDVAVAAQIALGALPRIMIYAPAIRTLPGAGAALEHVATYAHAASHANAIWLHAASGPDDVQKLVAVAMPLRARAFAVLEMGVTFNLFDASVVEGLRSGTGYQDLAQDLHAGSAMLRARWSELEGRTPFTMADLVAMGEVATRLDEALGLKEIGNVPATTRATADRQRAFTLLARSYDEVRRALQWIRWHEDDMAQIAPSLWLRPGSNRRSSTPDAPASPPADPSGSAPANAPPTAPASPTEPTAVVASAPISAGEPGPKGTPFTA